MDLQDLGSLGEFIAAIGVVFSLIFVGFQIRQNTKAIHRQEANITLDQWSRVRRLILEHDHLADILLRGQREPDALTAAESAQFNLLLAEFLRTVSLLYGRTKEGLIDAREWAAMKEQTRQVVTQPGGKRFWDENRASFDEAFAREIDGT